jgi:hypothetical protein
MGRSAKIVRSVSYEKVKKIKKGQVWRYVDSHIAWSVEFVEIPVPARLGPRKSLKSLNRRTKLVNVAS